MNQRGVIALKQFSRAPRLKMSGHKSLGNSATISLYTRSSKLERLQTVAGCTLLLCLYIVNRHLSCDEWQERNRTCLHQLQWPQYKLYKQKRNLCHSPSPMWVMPTTARISHAEETKLQAKLLYHRHSRK